MFWQLPQELLIDPQQQNSYSYARNNPITLSDPTGKSVASVLGALTGAKTAVNNWLARLLNSQSSSVASASESMKSSNMPNDSSSVLGISAWKSQMPDRPNGCFDVCSEIVGYRPNPGNTINTAKENGQGLTILPSARQGVKTIDNYLLAGQSITVGVNRQIGYDVGNKNKATNHFVVIMGSGYDNGNKYYKFFDTGTTNKEAGTSFLNRLYLNLSDYSLSGSSQYTSKKYTVTEVRPQ